MSSVKNQRLLPQESDRHDQIAGTETSREKGEKTITHCRPGTRGDWVLLPRIRKENLTVKKDQPLMVPATGKVKSASCPDRTGF